MAQINGSLGDLLTLLKMADDPGKHNILLMGNFVDEEIVENNIESVLACLLLKIMYPEKFFIIRGHEEADMGEKFAQDVKKKFGRDLKMDINTIFKYFSIAAVVNNNLLCVSGGIGKNTRSIKDLELTKPIDVGNSAVSQELLFSMPSNRVKYLVKNPKGFGYFFGREAAAKFCEYNKIKRIIATQPVVQNGYETNGPIIAFTSVPNYDCYQHPGTIISIDIDSNLSIQKYEKPTTNVTISMKLVAHQDKIIAHMDGSFANFVQFKNQVKNSIEILDEAYKDPFFLQELKKLNYLFLKNLVDPVYFHLLNNLTTMPTCEQFRTVSISAMKRFLQDYIRFDRGNVYWTIGDKQLVLPLNEIKWMHEEHNLARTLPEDLETLTRDVINSAFCYKCVNEHTCLLFYKLAQLINVTGTGTQRQLK